jgi:hypothetical protein
MDALRWAYGTDLRITITATIEITMLYLCGSSWLDIFDLFLGWKIIMGTGINLFTLN